MRQVMRLLFLLLSMAVATSANASEKLLGLVEVPALHSLLNRGGPDEPVGPVPLFTKPDHSADVAAVVRDRRHLDSGEHGYEQVSAAVYGLGANAGGGFWYKLKYLHGEETLFAWLNQADAGQYRPLTELLRGGLTHFTENWDGRLYEAPDLASPSRSLAGSDVRVASFHGVPGDLWVLVVLVKGNICTGGGTEIIATGWVPANAKSGAATIWYSSRGC